MTQNQLRFFCGLGSLAILASSSMGGSAAVAGEASFERAYQTQQKGYAEYYRGIMNLNGSAGPADHERLRAQHVEPARAEAKKIRKEAMKNVVREGFQEFRSNRNQLEQIRMAEGKGKRPEADTSAESGSSQVKARAPRQFSRGRDARKSDGSRKNSAPSQDANAIEDVVDF